jgi:hypothetical protein
MNRWIEKFENHQFQEVWKKIYSAMEELVADNKELIPDTLEIDRCKKVFSLIDCILNACDPEIIPESVWDKFYEQSYRCWGNINKYVNTGIFSAEIKYILEANNNLDNLLTYVIPYQIVSEEAVRSVMHSFVESKKTIQNSFDSFQEDAKKALIQMNEIKNNALINFEQAEVLRDKIKTLESSFFDDSKEECLSSRMNKLATLSEENYEKIQSYKNLLIDGDSASKSIASEIELAHEKVNNEAKKISALLNESESNISDFKEFHEVVFGEKNDEGVFEGGLKSEIKAREKHLEEFKAQQETRYTALNKEIESLIPGATTAGLASAYHDLKISFDKPIKTYSRLFYGSMVFLMLTAFVSITQGVSWNNIHFVDLTDPAMLFINILNRLPIMIPVVWLSLFASKRRSESLRLQQEYAHKEAIAKSYKSFKDQIDALGESDSELMNKLLSSAIGAVSKNASDTLDKKHGDKTPVHEGVDCLLEKMEKCKKIFS